MISSNVYIEGGDSAEWYIPQVCRSSHLPVRGAAEP